MIVPGRYTQRIMFKPTGLDRATVRAQFNEHRGPDHDADFLFREVERRMLERLELIKLEPVERIVDVGCGSGKSLATLAVRYPGAQIIGADLADRTLADAAGKNSDRATLGEAAKRWFSRIGVGGARQLPSTTPLWLVTDAHALALAEDSMDMVWSNLAAHWFDDPLAAVAEWQRVIRPNGLLLFSAFGVDTLKEVRPPQRPRLTPVGDTASREFSAWPAFQDMHDWGDALSAAGFADPVMDVERLVLTYEDSDRFWRDAEGLSMLTELRSSGQTPGNPEAGTCRLSIELIYGHAWCPPVKRRRDGLATVQFYRSGSKL